MPDTIVQIGTTISLTGLMALVFYFAYWKGKIDTTIETLREDGVKFTEIFRVLREILEKVKGLQVSEEHINQRLDNLEKKGWQKETG